ncbi:MarR family winged helix-turn-helix transcriptional regulator [Streptococcus loxodontisalivarius]|uniref:DNA-binding MarR family transcriptional regulator n=1 Tax=Streptococcus loxodontisalivarius TaxID=1349415 RepID=A0ABS2PUB4_9STRE|nr:MarR family transcriptional regulator [Streptococcus loxodontisalivarius]MBM7643644.1 DNA-binding MarR family transcriptional regulator [Streptococcus loxodontisalivarius]
MDRHARGDYLMTQITLLNGRYFNKLLLERGAKFSAEQGKILAILRDFGDNLTASQISDYSGLAKNTLTTMLNNLEKAELIQSVQDKQDKRKRLISLSELGKQEVEHGEAVSQDLHKSFYQGFSKDEIAIFEEQLERILHNVKKRNEDKND